LDFGVKQFRSLTSQCKFPWLLANVQDPALGEEVPIGNSLKTHIHTVPSTGLKMGFIGIGEREWLATINSLPPNIVYRSATATSELHSKELREAGVDVVIAVSHAREPNDVKLARQTGTDVIDIVLSGHDHFYNHLIVNDVHVLRSGTDFKQLSYIEGWKTEATSGKLAKWDFRIVRRDVVSSIPENQTAVALVERLTKSLKGRLERPIGYTLAPLDARFTTVRLKESNLGNFVCDLMRSYHPESSCALMCGGTLRGDQIYPPGEIKLKDIMNWDVSSSFDMIVTDN
jgi:5'-nucleotidase